MLTTYKKIEEIVLPQLTNFEQDLTVSDKVLLKKYDGPFLYGFRNAGTNLYKLDLALFNYSYSIEEIKKSLNNCWYVLTYSNKNFLYFDGSELQKINLDELQKIFENHIKQVEAQKEKVEKINVFEIALDLWQVMKDFKTKWRKLTIESDIPCRRRFRNHFDFQKIKWSNDIKDIEKQLYKNITIA